jgi:hypothetical protein
MISIPPKISESASKHEFLQSKSTLLGSLLAFTHFFYKLRTGREFELSFPDGRESHYISISRVLTKAQLQEIWRLIINLPPRYGKTEMVIHFIAWAMAHYPDSNFIYVSYSHTLAKKQTQTIRQIMSMPMYHYYFGIKISVETSAKDNFETNFGGSVYAAGAGGSITGRGAGIKGAQRFGGAIIIDDIHKPSEVTSDTIRQGINEWFYNTLQSRVNGPHTPIIFIGQRLHEDDLASNLVETGQWETLIIPALDMHNNPLHKEMHSREQLLQMKEQSPYEFASQYQQDPVPAGGGIFKPEWFVLLDDEPQIIATFITADTAETDKSYNDATVFSFWGLYKLRNGDIVTDEYGVHLLDCAELRLEPKDLRNSFMDFYTTCMRHSIKPKVAAIERKSTGVTLVSVLSELQGLRILAIDRSAYSDEMPAGMLNNKTNRFLMIQPFIAAKHVSLPRYGKHTHMVVEHMRKITANNSHRHDDIADTVYDAIRVALIDKIILTTVPSKGKREEIANYLMGNQLKAQAARANYHDSSKNLSRRP